MANAPMKRLARKKDVAKIRRNAKKWVVIFLAVNHLPLWMQKAVVRKHNSSGRRTVN
jgi:hypothetical protein